MSLPPGLYPLRFEPVLKRAIWGGRRLSTLLGKSLGPQNDYAESWEVADMGPDQSRVADGPLRGLCLSELVTQYDEDLLGRHAGRNRFPLLVKLIDAQERLSVQVHPDDDHAARLAAGACGKTEAWVILHADSHSRIYAGLKPEIDRSALEHALTDGTVEQCLHSFAAQPGDCVFLPAGTVHSIGDGIVLVEVQQPSDITYRLFDWGRRDAQGRPRPLHIEQALAVIDFQRGPVNPVQPRQEGPDDDRQEHLVSCDHFVLERRRAAPPFHLGEQGRFHVAIGLNGSAQIKHQGNIYWLRKGDTLLIPASVGPVDGYPETGVTFLDCWLP